MSKPSVKLTRENCSTQLRLWLESQLEHFCDRDDSMVSEWFDTILGLRDETIEPELKAQFGQSKSDEIRLFSQELISRRNKDIARLAAEVKRSKKSGKKGKKRRSAGAAAASASSSSVSFVQSSASTKTSKSKKLAKDPPIHQQSKSKSHQSTAVSSLTDRDTHSSHSSAFDAAPSSDTTMSVPIGEPDSSEVFRKEDEEKSVLLESKDETTVIDDYNDSTSLQSNSYFGHLKKGGGQFGSKKRRMKDRSSSSSSDGTAQRTGAGMTFTYTTTISRKKSAKSAVSSSSSSAKLRMTHSSTSEIGEGSADTIGRQTTDLEKETIRLEMESDSIGRKCECQATVHECFINCTLCGYIVCKLEGQGLCPHCRSGYVTKSATLPIDDYLSSTTTTEDRDDDAALAKALAARDRLLKYGREKAVRTRVIDDQGDFYATEASNQWLSQLERQRAKERAQEDEERMQHTHADSSVAIQIDLGSQRVLNEDSSDILSGKRYVHSSVDREKELKQQNDDDDHPPSSDQVIGKGGDLGRYYGSGFLTTRASEVYASLQKLIADEEAKVEAYIAKSKGGGTKDGDSAGVGDDSAITKENNALSKLADGPYMSRDKDDFSDSDSDDDDDSEDGSEQKKNDQSGISDFGMQMAHANPKRKKKWMKQLGVKVHYKDSDDQGICLSMHQPWASLLVYGIKRVEGRSWNTKFRQRLWIASAKREPTMMEIQELENEYMSIYGAQKRSEINFPEHYPTSALLGCVDLIDCVNQDDYQKKYLSKGLRIEPNASNYCFIVENPRRLLLPGFISGDHKLWKMPSARLRGQQKGLIPADTRWYYTVGQQNHDHPSGAGNGGGSSSTTTKRKKKKRKKKKDRPFDDDDNQDIVVESMKSVMNDDDRSDYAPKCSDVFPPVQSISKPSVPSAVIRETVCDGDSVDRCGDSSFIWTDPLIIESISYKTALCIAPIRDENVMNELNEIRSKYDPGYPRWMPHINLLYPFIGSEYFELFSETFAKERIKKICDDYQRIGYVPFNTKKKHSSMIDDGCNSIRVSLECNKNGKFAQKKTNEMNLHLEVSNKSLQNLMKDLVNILLNEPLLLNENGGLITKEELNSNKLYKNLKSMTKKKFKPHLTIGKVPLKDADRVHNDLMNLWNTKRGGHLVTFEWFELLLISREEKPEEPFQILHRIPL